MATTKTLIGNIKGPKGDKGDMGATGVQGPVGPQGKTGATGAAGPQGTQGPKGDTGTQGPKGDKGDTGAAGATGAAGQRGSRWSQGSAITGTNTTAAVFTGTGIADALINDNYLNTSTGNTYRCTVAGAASVAKWVYTGCIRGVTGPTGPQGATGATGATGPQGAVGPKGDTGKQGAKGDTGATGATGPQGQRGSRWSQGTAITGTNTTAAVFSGSGITDALVNDNYLNISTGNTYRCTVAGNASTAKWAYSGCIKGVAGATGPQGPQGEPGPSGEITAGSVLNFTPSKTFELPKSGESVGIIIGKTVGDLSDLDTRLKNTAESMGNGVYTSDDTVEGSTFETRLDADTLGGQLPGYYTKQADIGNVSNLTTNAKTLVGAANELNKKVEFTVRNSYTEQDTFFFQNSYILGNEVVIQFEVLSTVGLPSNTNLFRISDSAAYPKKVQKIPAFCRVGADGAGAVVCAEITTDGYIKQNQSTNPTMITVFGSYLI